MVLVSPKISLGMVGALKRLKKVLVNWKDMGTTCMARLVLIESITPLRCKRLKETENTFLTIVTEGQSFKAIVIYKCKIGVKLYPCLTALHT